jgi:LmbE family N-acetylglucosaminyl deacetylase
VTHDSGTHEPARPARSAHLTRRLLLGLSAAGGGVALLSTVASARTGDLAVEPGWQPGPTLSVVAHPDDDLFFLNPNVSLAIRHGRAEVVSVVVTAAEGDGRNVDTAAPDRTETPVDYPGYATARHRGLRRAYALMAGRPADSPWNRAVLTMPDELTVEHYALAADPRVQLYLLNVAHTYNANGTAQNTMVPLWSGALHDAPTQPSLELPRPVQQVTRAGLIDCLAELIRRHHPAVIRTLDPDPEHDWKQSSYVVSDHLDHTAVARFTLAAAQAYVQASGRAPVVEHYRGYANRYWPRNLSQAVVAEKASYIQAYAGADDGSCPAPGCGDHQLGLNPFRSTHIYSTAERYGPSSSWLARGADGALVAVAALAGRATVWTQRDAGSLGWDAPYRIGGGWITPALAVAAGGDGRTHLVGLRRTEHDGGKATIDVVHAVRRAGRFGAWQSLDGPDSSDSDDRRQREVGVPAIAVDGDGRLWVFVRDYRGVLSARHEKSGGGWTQWHALDSGLVQDSPTAMTTRAGLVEVLVPGEKYIYRWRQRTAGGRLVADHARHSTPAASGGLHAVESAGGGVCVYFRQAGTATVLAYRERATLTGWADSPDDLGGEDGTGPVAAVGRLDVGVDSVVLAHRNARYSTAVALPGGAQPVWHRLRGAIVGAPALAADQSGRLVLAVLGQDGRLHVKRQEHTSPGSAFGPWSTL